MYVPRARIASRLLRAEDNRAVRTVRGQEFDNIVDDCEAVMRELTWESLFEHRDFVLEAIGMIRSGHTMAAQALLTLVIENQRNLAVGVGTLAIALLTLFATVVVAF
ncbi:hypothetical protein [Corynebacterium amycolatum]|uniref:hypothetical protein n=1 Tax=Corynebacterium amycolatum TaxID=43765 RepID=UPI001CCA9F8D|nr:hypothetical protein [Corynebacterium amycolatum]MCA0444290.1 hypothetical protein [Corynebacterium amycolatum]